MPQETPVGDVMTHRVRTATPAQSLRELWPVLVEEACHHLPVVEGERCVGMVSVTDLVRVARESGVRSLTQLPEERTAGEIMTRELETVYVDDPVDVAIDRIGRGDLHALVVLDDAERLAGIVTHHDLLRYLTT